METDDQAGDSDDPKGCYEEQSLNGIGERGGFHTANAYKYGHCNANDHDGICVTNGSACRILCRLRDGDEH